MMDCPHCKDKDVVATDSKEKVCFEFRYLKCGDQLRSQLLTILEHSSLMQLSVI